MINILREIKKAYIDLGYDCEIAEIEDVLIDVKPFIVLTPVYEKWIHDLLGNPSNKDIKFKIQIFKEHIENEYDTEIDSTLSQLKQVLTSKEVKKDITTYLGTTVTSDLIDENSTIVIIAEITLKLHRR